MKDPQRRIDRLRRACNAMAATSDTAADVSALKAAEAVLKEFQTAIADAYREMGVTGFVSQATAAHLLELMNTVNDLRLTTALSLAEGSQN